METTTTSYDLLNNLLLGGLLGILGQSIRVIVGLKKLNEKRTLEQDEQEAFTGNRLVMSLFIGFTAGAIAILVKSPVAGGFTNELILAIIASGYAGADFIEGIFNTYFKKFNTTATTASIASAELPAQANKSFQKRTTAKPVESEFTSIEATVKIAILRTLGHNHPDPDSLPNDTSMSDVALSDIQYIHLTGILNEIANSTNPNVSISVSDVKGCDTVQDFIDLVTESSKLSI